jgi:hypothetical protein
MTFWPPKKKKGKWERHTLSSKFQIMYIVCYVFPPFFARVRGHELMTAFWGILLPLSPRREKTKKKRKRRKYNPLGRRGKSATRSFRIITSVLYKKNHAKEKSRRHRFSLFFDMDWTPGNADENRNKKTNGTSSSLIPLLSGNSFRSKWLHTYRGRRREKNPSNKSTSSK